MLALMNSLEEGALENGDRSLVLVIGSGLHKHLSAHGVEYHSGHKNGLTSWKDFLAELSLRRGFGHAEATEHSDPTSTWESMLLGSARLPSRNESSAAGHVSSLIEAATPPRNQALSAFGEALGRRRFRDIVTLNFDPTLERAIGAEESPVKPTRLTGSRPAQRHRLRVEAENTRIWHPHGLARRGVPSRGFQLGFRKYAKSVAEVTRDIESFRAWRRIWFEATGLKESTSGHQAFQEELRRVGRRGARWWEQLITSDVAFIGCSLDRAELDLWLVLHERQRQLAQFEKKPKAFFLHPADGFPAHIRSGPAGLIPVVTRDHDEAWELLFGKWWA